MRRIASTPLGHRYVYHQEFRVSVSIFQGMTTNFLYAIFRMITGIHYASVWFISIAVYYMVLGILRLYLLHSYRRSRAFSIPDNKHLYEYHCYFRTAIYLFLLHIPMGGMIILMVRTNAGFSYPGYVIYLSALYTFYSVISSVINLIKFRKLGNPILSAAKVLHFISAMMSILGLQTAMIARFSTHQDAYRRFMNTVTGSCVYFGAVLIAMYMLFYAIRKKKELSNP